MVQVYADAIVLVRLDERFYVMSIYINIILYIFHKFHSATLKNVPRYSLTEYFQNQIQSILDRGLSLCRVCLLIWLLQSLHLGVTRILYVMASHARFYRALTFAVDVFVRPFAAVDGI